MFRRTLEAHLRAARKRWPLVTLTGPRQAGKTTLALAACPDLPYVNLEAPDVREHALEDPRGFLGQLPDGAVLDEVQRVPDLFSYLQVHVDEDKRPGRFVLTGSQNFLLLEKITQSLAGRVRVLHLHPFSLSELSSRVPWDPLRPEHPRDWRRRAVEPSLTEALHTGFYPPIHDRDLEAGEWLASYRDTYVERDVRQIIKVMDLDAFRRFLGLCAGRNGQLLNANSIGNDAGVDHTTVRRWISVLEASFLVMLLRPHHRNFGKRVMKSPKLYFLDTGLLCSLLGIRTPKDLAIHAQRGSVFESLVLAEIVKAAAHRGERPNVSFWRDSAGHEVDFVVEESGRLHGFEAKSGETLASSFFTGLQWWHELAGEEAGPSVLVYGGAASSRRGDTVVRSWQTL